MSANPRLGQIRPDPSAPAGSYPKVNAGVTAFEYDTPPTTLDGLTDVDTSTTPPSHGDTLVYDATSGLWFPGAVGGAGSLTVQDENGNVATGVTQIDFQGAGVTATAGAGEVVVTIPGGGSGDVVKIAETVLAANTATITFSSIPQTYRHLKLVISGRSARASFNNDPLIGQLNGDTNTANYDAQWWDSAGDSTTLQTGQAGVHLGLLAAATAATGRAGVMEVVIPDYVGTTFWKSMQSQTSICEWGNLLIASTWRSTAAITSMTLRSMTGNNLLAGTVATLFGLA